MRSAAETRALIIAAAAKEFLAGGYSRTGVDKIAQRAGVSTRTVYGLIPTKTDLLKEAMKTAVDASFGERARADADTGDVRTSLERLLTDYADLALADDSVRVVQLIAGERRHVPAIVDSYQQATMRIGEVFEAWVRENQAAGRLRPMDPAAAALVMRSMINEIQRQMLLGWREGMEAEERQQWIRICADLFLAGAAAHPSPSP